MLLSANFTLDEFAAVSSGEAVPEEYLDKARAMATLLQAVRDLVGVPLVVTSYWRSRGREKQLGHVYSSQHVTGSAADVRPIGTDSLAVIAAIVKAKAAGTFPDFGQLIGYPAPDRHLHISLPDRASGKKNEVLFRVNDHNTRADYIAWDGLQTPPAWGSTAASVPAPAVLATATGTTTTRGKATAKVTPAPPAVEVTSFTAEVTEQEVRDNSTPTDVE